MEQCASLWQLGGAERIAAAHPAPQLVAAWLALCLSRRSKSGGEVRAGSRLSFGQAGRVATTAAGHEYAGTPEKRDRETLFRSVANGSNERSSWHGGCVVLFLDKSAPWPGKSSAAGTANFRPFLRPAYREHSMSYDVVGRRSDTPRCGQDPPLADWFVALNHDSPLRKPPGLPISAENSSPHAAVPNRAGAADALLRAGPQPAAEVGALIDDLRSEIDVVRFHAAIAIGDFGPAGRAAVSALIAASHWDVEPAVRVGAAMALWKIDRRVPLVLYILTEALGDANELICWVAADGLGQIGPRAREAVPALRLALRRDFRLAIVKTSVKFALQRIDPKAPAGAA